MNFSMQALSFMSFPTLHYAFHPTKLVMFLCYYGSTNDMSLLYKPQTTNSINHNDVIIRQCTLLNDQGSNHQLFILSQWLFNLCQHVWQNLTFMFHYTTASVILNIPFICCVAIFGVYAPIWICNLSEDSLIFTFFFLDKEDAKHDPHLKHNALLVWSPVDEIPNSKCKYCIICLFWSQSNDHFKIRISKMLHLLPCLDPSCWLLWTF